MSNHCLLCDSPEMANDYFGKAFMIHNSIWGAIFNEQEAGALICWDCVERRLGRKLTPTDFTDCYLNEVNERLQKLQETSINMPKQLIIPRTWLMEKTINSIKANFIAVWDASQTRYLIKNKQSILVAHYAYNQISQQYEVSLHTNGYATVTINPTLLSELVSLCNKCYKQLPKLTTTK